MAKALLFLRAAGGVGSLASRLQQAVDTNFSSLEQVSVRLMQHLEPDLLTNPGSSHPCPDLVMEILAAPGLPFAEILPVLGLTLEDLEFHPAHSLGLLMHTRYFRPCTPQPVNIHYLMVRRTDYSPADYHDYYSHYHGRFGVRMQGIEGYSQNYIDQQGSKRLCETLGLEYREVTSISEMNVSSMESLLSSPSMAELAEPTTEDELRFVDREQSVMYSSRVCHVHGDPTSALATAYPQHYDGPELA